MFLKEDASYLTPMQVSVYPLNKVLEKPIYSNLDPTDYFSPEEILGQQIYTTSRYFFIMSVTGKVIWAS